jgi:poly-beta-1,6-N-acetyl-D-glucosamine N-deacetylase
MIRHNKKLLWILLLFSANIFGEANRGKFVVFAYHDIIDNHVDKHLKNPFDVSLEHFRAHLHWLKENKYHVLSIKNILDAADGEFLIPDKSVLLTFDDGFESFYSNVLPLLKKHHYPATLALVGNWMDGKEKHDYPEKRLLSWEQVRAIKKSGLVEIASHSYDLHHNVTANPQGDFRPAAVTHRYDPATASYESDDQFRSRINLALQQSAEFIFQHIGLWPRVLVWPYGEYNNIAVDAARQYGMPVTMALGNGDNILADLSVLHRLILYGDPDAKSFADMVKTSHAKKAQ